MPSSLHNRIRVSARGSRQPAEPACSMVGLLASSQIEAVLAQLDDELIGLPAARVWIADTAAQWAAGRLRLRQGLALVGTDALRLCFAGTHRAAQLSLALRVGQLLHRLGYLRKGHLTVLRPGEVPRDADAVATVLAGARGGVLMVELSNAHEPLRALRSTLLSPIDDLAVILSGSAEQVRRVFKADAVLAARFARRLDLSATCRPELVAAGGQLIRRAYQVGVRRAA